MKLKAKIAAALMGVLVFLGIGVSPALASAETVDEQSIVSVETSEETGVETDKELVDEETGEEEENGEITVDLSNLTYEEFLAFVEMAAKATGNEELWEATIASINKAIDEKQLTLAVVLLIVVAVLMIVKIISDWVLKAKEKAHIKNAEQTDKTVQMQTKALNGMIDEEEKIASGVARAEAREKKLAKAGLEQNAALRCLVRGVQLHDTARDEALRHLNNSDKQYNSAKE